MGDWTDPDGTGMRVYASGLRNAVGIAVHPGTGELWASVNERDGLGDDLVPDYVTRHGGRIRQILSPPSSDIRP